MLQTIQMHVILLCVWAERYVLDKPTLDLLALIPFKLQHSHLYHFEKSAIEAIKSDKVTFIQVKSINVTSGFNLRKLKKSDRRSWHTENLKRNVKKLILKRPHDHYRA